MQLAEFILFTVIKDQCKPWICFCANIIDGNLAWEIYSERQEELETARPVQQKHVLVACLH